MQKSNLILKWSCLSFNRYDASLRYPMVPTSSKSRPSTTGSLRIRSTMLTTEKIILSLILIVQLGCTVKVNTSSKTTLDNHNISIKPGSELMAQATEPYLHMYQYLCGEILVTLNNKLLVVNDKRYRKLLAGEVVAINNGEVVIDKKPYRGTVMSHKEILELAPVKECKKIIAGYVVTVRPGSLIRFSTQLGGGDTYRVGRTVVNITDNKLYVNDVYSKALKPGDAVLVEHDKVKSP